MEPTSHPWQPSTSAHALASSCIDSDCHWDATVQLLALGDDDPAQELYDGTISGGKKPEPEDGGGRGVPAAAAIFQPRTYECGPIIGTLALTDKPSADIRLSAMLSEDDIAFIVSSTAHDDAPADVPIDPGSPSAAAGTSELATSVQQRADPRRRSAAATEAMALTTAPVSSAEEARRERNRLKVRRLYHRKLILLNGLRTEVADLEDRLESLKLAASNNTSTTRLTGSGQQPQPTIGGPVKPTVDYAALLEQLALTKQQLQQENEDLRLVMSKYIRNVHAVSVNLLALRKPSSVRIRIKSVTRLECADLRRRTLTKVRNFARSRALFQYAGRICGWDSLHIIQGGVFHFNVEKVVPGYSVDKIAALSWDVLTDPRRLAKVHSTAINMKCYVLQVIDDDNVVIFHEHRVINRSKETAMVVRMILLLSRVTTASGHVLMLTSLDRDKWVLKDHSASQSQDAVVWNDLFCWLQYKDAGDDNGCACTFAGSAPIIGSNMYFWMVEIVQLAVRWESMTIGPAAYSLKATGDEDHLSGHTGG